MVENSNLEFERTLRQRFTHFVGQQGHQMTALLDIIRERGWTTFAFGGAPRGVFDDGRHYRPRDLDLVFDTEHFSFFESAFERHIIRRNRFGGLNLRIGDLSIDAWPLGSTWAFREGHVSEPSFQKLPKTTFLNIDGIIIELSPPKGKPRRIHDGGFFSAWTKKTLDINLRENPFPALCVVRTLQISRRFGFRVSHRLSLYLWHALNSISAEDLEKAQVSHYGKIEFDTRHLLQIENRLEKHLSKQDLFPFALFSIRPDQLEFGSRWHGLLGKRQWLKAIDEPNTTLLRVDSSAAQSFDVTR